MVKVQNSRRLLSDIILCFFQVSVSIPSSLLTTHSERIYFTIFTRWLIALPLNPLLIWQFSNPDWMWKKWCNISLGKNTQTSKVGIFNSWVLFNFQEEKNISEVGYFSSGYDQPKKKESVPGVFTEWLWWIETQGVCSLILQWTSLVIMNQWCKFIGGSPERRAVLLLMEFWQQIWA